MTDWADQSSFIPLPPLRERTVNEAMAGALRSCPERVALRDESTVLTYAALHDAACRTAGGLAGHGVGRGTHVLVMLDNHCDNVIVWLALSYLGAVSVPVNTALVGTPLRHVIVESGAAVAVVEQQYLAACGEAGMDRLAVVVVRGEPPVGQGPRVVEFGAVSAATPVDPVPVHPWDLHSVMYTSGSTSMPKGVLIPHGLTYNRAATFMQAEDAGNAVLLSSLPLFHVVAQCGVVLRAIILRGTAVVLPSFSASRFWRQCRHFGATETVLMGAMASFLLSRPPSPDDSAHAVRRVGLVPCIAESDRFAERFGVEVTAGYGMTEIGTIAKGPGKPSSCGYIHPEYEYRLVDEFDVEVPEGTPGELVIRGKLPWTLTAGYLARADLTAELWRNLWLHTGDLMRRTPDGELVFEGRRKSMIRRRGENIAPAAVEAELQTHPAIVDCVVVGVPSPDGEEEVMAVVQAEGALVDPSVLLDHLWNRLPYFMLPRYIAVSDELPRTPTHKVDVAAVSRSFGIGDAWDREAAGVRVTRAGVLREGAPA